MKKFGQSCLVVTMAWAAAGCAANLGGGTRVVVRGEHAEVKVSGQGLVESDGGAIECGALAGKVRDACSAKWIDWDHVSMTATPSPGWRFAGWHSAADTAPYVGEKGATTFTYVAAFVPRRRRSEASSAQSETRSGAWRQR
jgi:hypothetical protein